MHNAAALRTSNGIAIPLRGVDVQVRLSDLMQSTTVAQSFSNDSDQVLEIEYQFPVSCDAVLLDVRLQMGERHYVGSVYPKKAAEQQYEAAIEEGNLGLRVQRKGDGLYSISLGNVAPRENITVTYRFAQVLHWEADKLRVLIATTIAPRYGFDECGPNALARAASMTAHYPLSLQVAIAGDLAKAKLSSPTHTLVFDSTGDELIARTTTGAVLDRDFVLVIEAQAEKPRAIVATYGGETVGMVSHRIPNDCARDHQPRSIVVLADCSGSMAGDSIEQVRNGLRALLQQLDARDEIQLIRFGSHWQSDTSGCVAANPRNLARAGKFVASLRADMGGTELMKALHVALASPASHRADVLLITDGQVQLNELDAIRLRETSRRVFVVAVGSAAAEGPVRRIASETQGVVERATPNESLDGKILRQCRRMHFDKTDKTAISWPQEPLWSIRPGGHGRYPGDTGVTMFCLPARFASCVQAEAAASREIDVRQIPSDGPESEAVIRVAAYARWLDGKANSRQNEAVEIATRYRFVTDDTDCVLTVEREAETRTVGVPRLAVVPQMMAAGWGGTGRVAGVSNGLREALVNHCMAFPASHFDLAESMPVMRQANRELASRRARPNVGGLGNNDPRTSLFDDTPMGLMIQLGALWTDSGEPFTDEWYEKCFDGLSLPDDLAALVELFLAEGSSRQLVVLSLHRFFSTGLARRQLAEPMNPWLLKLTAGLDPMNLDTMVHGLYIRIHDLYPHATRASWGPPGKR